MTVTELFEQLVVIPSPSRRERAVAEYVRAVCDDLGLAVDEDDSPARHGGECGNLLVRLPATGAGPTILLCAHIDTVETGDAPIRWTCENGEYASVGDTILGADDKTGVACALAALPEILRAPSRGEVRLVFTVVEERELRGAKALPDAWLEGVDAGFALDHGDPDEIVVGTVGKIAMRVTMRGVPGHGAMPDRRINAAHALATAVSRLPSGRLDAESTCNLGVVRGGSAINVIPGEAYAEYEIRSHDPLRLAHYADRAERIIRNAAAEASVHVAGEAEPRRASVEIEREDCYPPFRLDDDALAVRSAVDAVRHAGGDPRTRLGPGGSDANALNARGVPTCIMGCGMHGAHSHAERAVVAEMEQCVRALTALVGA